MKNKQKIRVWILRIIALVVVAAMILGVFGCSAQSEQISKVEQQQSSQIISPGYSQIVEDKSAKTSSVKVDGSKADTANSSSKSTKSTNNKADSLSKEDKESTQDTDEKKTENQDDQSDENQQDTALPDPAGEPVQDSDGPETNNIPETSDQPESISTPLNDSAKYPVSESEPVKNTSENNATPADPKNSKELSQALADRSTIEARSILKSSALKKEGFKSFRPGAVPEITSETQELYNLLRQVYAQAGSDPQKLFDYVVDKVSWTDDRLDRSIEEYAINTVQSYQANCFGYAALYYYLLYFLGYDVSFIRGNIQYTNGSKSEHAMVMLTDQNNRYLYDPQSTDQFGNEGVYIYQTPPKELPIRFVFEGCEYRDVYRWDEYFEAVSFCTRQGVMSAMLDYGFYPDEPVDLGMISAILYKMNGSPYVDEKACLNLSDSLYYKIPACWMTAQPVFRKFEDLKNFDGSQVLKKAELACLLFAISNQKADLSLLKSIQDVDDGDPYSDAIAWSIEKGIFDTTNGRFRPDQKVSRGMLAMALYQYMNR